MYNDIKCLKLNFDSFPLRLNIISFHFRYIPGNSNQKTYYVRPGVKVDKTQSDAHKVTLRRLTIDSTGRYRCEVSTEAPSFATVSNYNDLYVVGKFAKSFKYLRAPT